MKKKKEKWQKNKSKEFPKYYKCLRKQRALKSISSLSYSLLTFSRLSAVLAVELLALATARLPVAT